MHKTDALHDQQIIHPLIHSSNQFLNNHIVKILHKSLYTLKILKNPTTNTFQKLKIFNSNRPSTKTKQKLKLSTHQNPSSDTIFLHAIRHFSLGPAKKCLKRSRNQHCTYAGRSFRVTMIPEFYTNINLLQRRYY